ncbi:MAG TPA: M23 family metallopeptidase, partial [Acidimicrobiales bacterium]
MKAHTPGRLGSAGVVLTALAALAAPALAASPPAGASTPPANAPSLQQRKAQANQQRQAAQAQLDLARANDDQVQAEVTRLDAAVVSEATKVAGADQALDTAKREVRSAQAAVNALRARTDRARRSLTAVAVSGYMSPPAEDAVTQILTAADLQQAARRQAFLVNVQATTTEVIDALRQAQQDETAAAERLQQVQSTAQARARAEEATQLELRAQQVAQAAAHSELQKRIAELLGETQAYAAQESQLEALITAAQAAARSVTGPVSNIGLIWPVHGPVTSEFGPRWGGFHPGIDIGAGYGAPIHAAKAGTVIFAGYYGGYGNFVVIDHGGAVATAYAHQSRIAVSQGQTVQQGQVIGYIGSTGYSTGPHLHFEVR